MISKIFTENRQKLPVFWPKNVIFLLIRQKKIMPQLRAKKYTPPSILPKMAQFLVYMILDIFSTKLERIFG